MKTHQFFAMSSCSKPARTDPRSSLRQPNNPAGTAAPSAKPGEQEYVAFEISWRALRPASSRPSQRFGGGHAGERLPAQPFAASLARERRVAASTVRSDGRRRGVDFRGDYRHGADELVLEIPR